MVDRPSPKPERLLFNDTNIFQISELLRWQEQLLDHQMSSVDLLLYETRSQQISELIQQLPG